MSAKYPNGYPYIGFMMLGLSKEERVTTLAKVLREWREKAGLTQQELADQVNAFVAPYGFTFGGKYGNQLISKYENGKCSPKLDYLIALAEVIEMNAVELAGYKMGHVRRMPAPHQEELANAFRAAAKVRKPRIVAKSKTAKITARSKGRKGGTAKVRVTAKLELISMLEKFGPDVSFGILLRSARHLCKLTQEGLSARCEMTGTHIHRITISNLENNKYKPSKAQIAALSKAMRIPQKFLNGQHAASLRKNA